ncbi:MAG: LIC12162 family protein [Elusimicrobiota bacterium]
MHLVTTALEDAQPESGPRILLGPWCRPYGRALSAAEDGAPMVEDPWREPQARQRAYDESLDLFERLLPVIANALNALHTASYSPRFWRIVVGPWLIRYVQIMKDRHERIRLALQSNPGLAATTLDPRDRITPGDTFAFAVLAIEDPYNFQIASTLLEKMGASCRPVRRAMAPTEEFRSRIFSTRSAFKSALESATDRVLSMFDIPVALHDLGLGAIDVARISRLSRWKARPLRRRAFPRSATIAWRPPSLDVTAGFKPKDSFERILCECIGQDLPAAFVESFKPLIEAASACVPPGTDVIVSANGWTYDEVFKTSAGLAADTGVRLVGIQHGGGYGLYSRSWQEELERSCTDSYWCWGWSGLDGDRRLRDVPAPSLSVAGDDRSAGSGLLCVVNAQPRYPYGFQSQALAERCLEGIEDLASFLRELPDDIRRQSRLRVTPQDNTWGWRQGERVSARFPDVGVEIADGPLHKRLRRSALTVIDHPATSLLEALSLDRPTLLFWRPEVWECRAAARPLLDGLRRAGVLFDEPRAAARAATLAWINPQVWWSRREVRAAVLAFRSQQAFSAENWRRRWATAINSEVSAARSRA